MSQHISCTSAQISLWCYSCDQIKYYTSLLSLLRPAPFNRMKTCESEQTAGLNISLCSLWLLCLSFCSTNHFPPSFLLTESPLAFAWQIVNKLTASRRLKNKDGKGVPEIVQAVLFLQMRSGIAESLWSLQVCVALEKSKCTKSHRHWAKCCVKSNQVKVKTRLSDSNRDEKRTTWKISRNKQKWGMTGKRKRDEPDSRRARWEPSDGIKPELCCSQVLDVKISN